MKLKELNNKEIPKEAEDELMEILLIKTDWINIINFFEKNESSATAFEIYACLRNCMFKLSQTEKWETECDAFFEEYILKPIIKFVALSKDELKFEIFTDSLNVLINEDQDIKKISYIFQNSFITLNSISEYLNKSESVDAAVRAIMESLTGRAGQTDEIFEEIAGELSMKEEESNSSDTIKKGTDEIFEEIAGELSMKEEESNSSDTIKTGELSMKEEEPSSSDTIKKRRVPNTITRNFKAKILIAAASLSGILGGIYIGFNGSKNAKPEAAESIEWQTKISPKDKESKPKRLATTTTETKEKAEAKKGAEAKEKAKTKERAEAKKQPKSEKPINNKKSKEIENNEKIDFTKLENEKINIKPGDGMYDFARIFVKKYLSEEKLIENNLNLKQVSTALAAYQIIFKTGEPNCFINKTGGIELRTSGRYILMPIFPDPTTPHAIRFIKLFKDKSL